MALSLMRIGKLVTIAHSLIVIFAGKSTTNFQGFFIDRPPVPWPVRGNRALRSCNPAKTTFTSGSSFYGVSHAWG